MNYPILIKIIPSRRPSALPSTGLNKKVNNNTMARKRRQDAEPEADVETEEEHPGSCDEEEQEEGDDELVSSEEDEEEADDDDDDDAPSSSKGPAAVIPPPLSLLPPSSIVSKSDGRYHNRRRLLVLSSRGITARYRHLLEDLRSLIPHSKKECKLDVGKNYSGSGGGGSGGGYGAAVNEIAEVRGCHAVLFLECRKRGQDGYLWLGRTSHSNDGDGITTKANGDGGGGGVAIEPKRHLMISGGPSVKFHITNIHTMDELKMTGNCMKGSRPVLSFDTSFDTIDHLKLIKHLFVDVFGTPRGHPKSKPFVDRVMGFYYADGKIWVRNYQILEETASTAKEANTQKKLTGHAHSTSLIEIGPRFILNPIRIFRGSFGGQTLYVNDSFVNPNVIRSMKKKEEGDKYARRKGAENKRKRRDESIVVPKDPLSDVFR